MITGFRESSSPATRAATLRVLVLVGCASLLALFAACRSGTPRTAGRGWSERGIASWYGKPFHGRQTASGEVYDMHEMTAAHKKLPFHSIVEVKNLDNGRQIRVRITDRGPFVRGRIIDLSYEAAKRLDMIGSGVAPVEIRVVGTDEPNADVSFTVQIGAFRDRRYAEALASRLQGPPTPRVEKAGEWYRVRIGAFEDEKPARKLRDRLQSQGHRAIVVRVPG